MDSSFVAADGAGGLALCRGFRGQDSRSRGRRAAHAPREGRIFRKNRRALPAQPHRRYGGRRPRRHAPRRRSSAESPPSCREACAVGADFRELDSAFRLRGRRGAVLSCRQFRDGALRAADFLRFADFPPSFRRNRARRSGVRARRREIRRFRKIPGNAPFLFRGKRHGNAGFRRIFRHSRGGRREAAFRPRRRLGGNAFLRAEPPGIEASLELRFNYRSDFSRRERGDGGRRFRARPQHRFFRKGARRKDFRGAAFFGSALGGGSFPARVFARCSGSAFVQRGRRIFRKNLRQGGAALRRGADSGSGFFRRCGAFRASAEKSRGARRTLARGFADARRGGAAQRSFFRRAAKKLGHSGLISFTTPCWTRTSCSRSRS